jgi:hypothetical protein
LRVPSPQSTRKTSSSKRTATDRRAPGRAELSWVEGRASSQPGGGQRVALRAVGARRLPHPRWRRRCGAAWGCRCWCPAKWPARRCCPGAAGPAAWRHRRRRRAPQQRV